MRRVGNEGEAERLQTPRSITAAELGASGEEVSAMPATLNVIFGPCAAGKTTYAHALTRRESAVAFVLDEWGARLFGPDLKGPIEFDWMLERLGRCNALIWSTAEQVLAAGTSVVLDIGGMRRADRDRIRQMAEAKGLSLQWHFVDAPKEVRRARVTDRNAAKGDTFVMEVTPQMFDMLEAIYDRPSPAELEGAILSVSNDGNAAAPFAAQAQAVR
jgi:predicted kinase